MDGVDRTDASPGQLVEEVLREISDSLRPISDDAVRKLVDAILTANRIVTHGAGRMGMTAAFFAMRLAQLGFRVHALNEPTTLGVSRGDLLILASMSGETQTVYDVAVLGKGAGAQLAVVTSRPDSRIGRLANTVVTLPVRSKVDHSTGVASIQPMTTLAEQCLMILFDIMVLLLMRGTNQREEDLWGRHRNLE